MARASCSVCGGPLHGSQEGATVCPRCAFGWALENPAVEEPEPESAEQRRVGPFRLIRVLGEGGMGVVLEALQEQPVRRRVALKWIRPGMDTATVLARFETERQALARMSSSHIAQVFDAGHSEDGRPWFAMEYVEGAWITEHCDAARMPIPQRLRLFVEVCRGVQHAHHKGVIHRDIKPSNVLVCGDGEKAVPKIIDFGLAKALGDPIVEHSMMTRLGQMVGTPAYMSPEQGGPAGFDVDTRADVYSLGVLLFELLTGHIPFDAADQAIEELRRRIREEDPPTPGARVAALAPDVAERAAERRGTSRVGLERALRGDLDWIAARALARDRSRRYGTPDELAADLLRHLANEPVLAGPPSVGYRARKLLRRHTAAVTAGSAIALLLVVTAVGMTIQAGRIARERDRAREALGYLKQVFEVSDPSEARGGDISARELLDKSAARIAEQLADKPELRAELSDTMGQVFRNLGLYDRARPLLGDALATRRRLLGDRHPDTLASINNVGSLLQEEGKLTEAEPYYREALEGYRRVRGADHPDTLRTVNFLASLLHEQGKLAEAEPYYREALDGLRRVLGDDHPDTLGAIASVGYLLQAQGKLAEAEPYYRQALEGHRRVVGDDHPHTLRSINNMGTLLDTQGKLAEAEPYYRETLAGRRRVFGDDHPDTLLAIHNLGSLLQAQGKFAEAETYCREGLDRSRRVLGNDHPDTLRSIYSMGNLLQAQGQLADAELHYRETLEGRRRVLGADHPHTLSSLHVMGFVLQAQGRLAEAEPYYREVLEGRRRVQGNEHPSTLGAMAALGFVLQVRGKHEEAEPYLRDALEGRRRVLGSDNLDTAGSLVALAAFLGELHRFEEAEPLAREAQQILDARLPAGHWRIEWVRSTLGESLAGLGRHAEAEPLLLEAAEALVAGNGAQAWHKRRAIERLASLYAVTSRPSEEARWRTRLATLP